MRCFTEEGQSGIADELEEIIASIAGAGQRSPGQRAARQ
jgi:hypothetical protein